LFVKILIFGAGRMGMAAAWHMLRSPGIAGVTLADADRSRVQMASRWLKDRRVAARVFDCARSSAARLMKGHGAALSAVPYRFNLALSRAAIQARVPFCDLGGNHDVVRAQFKLDGAARKKGVGIVPDCGVVPGLGSILVAHGVKKLDRVEHIQIRCGGIPQNPRPPLMYELFFSAGGLVNEYVEPSEIIREGKLCQVESLTGIEEIVFPPPIGRLEAFYTSGGTSTLCETFLGRVQTLDDKTIRHPGHAEKMRALAQLGLMSSKPLRVEGVSIRPRALLEKLLEANLVGDGRDILLLRVAVAGKKNGQPRTITYDIIDGYDEKNRLTGMQRTTAFSGSIIAQMLARGEIGPGIHRQEISVPTDRFLRELGRSGISCQETTSS
jgi:lysine 6-dehydrogenase